MPNVHPTNMQRYDIELNNAEEETLVMAALLNRLTRREVFELILLKAFAVQDQVNKLMTDRALKG